MQFISIASSPPPRRKIAGAAPGLIATSVVLSCLVPGLAWAQKPAPAPKTVKAAAKPKPSKSKTAAKAAKQTKTQADDGSRYVLSPKSSPLFSIKRTKALLETVKEAEKEAEEKREESLEAAREKAEKSGKIATPEGEKAKGEEESEAGDYLEAYLQYLKVRAFPNDTLDPRATQRAVKHRDAMPPAIFGGGDNGSGNVGGNPGNGTNPPGGKTGKQFDGIKYAPNGTPIGSNVAPAATGPTWEFVGPRNLPPPYQVYYGPPNSILSGRVNAIAFDPITPSVVYLVAAGGGVWKSTDGGSNWKVLSDIPTFSSLQASSVAVQPGNSNLVMVGMGDFDGNNGFGLSQGIMRSANGGQTWSNVASSPVSGLGGKAVSSIVFDPDNPNIVIATAGHPASRIYRSTNAGLTWTATQSPVGDWSQGSISGARDASGGRAYWASATRDGIYKSTDRGLTWAKQPVPLAFDPRPDSYGNIRVSASKVNPNVAYVIDGSTNLLDGRLFRTDNAGASWTDITGTYPDGFGFDSLARRSATPGYNWSQSFYDLPLVAGTFALNGTAREVVFGGGITIAGTVNGGPAFSDIGLTYQPGATARSHSDQHAVAFDPFNQYSTLIGNDGGVYRTVYNPATGTWSTAGGLQLSKTLGITQIYHADYHPTNPDIMITGAQDNASPYSGGDLQNWTNPGAGDGAGNAINPQNTLIQYASSQNQNVSLTTDGWQSAQGFTPFTMNGPYDGDRLPFIGTMAINPSRPNLLFVGTNYLWMWNQNTQSWLRHVGDKEFSTGGTVSAIAVSRTDANVVYVGTDDGKIFITREATAIDPTSGATKARWVQLQNGLPAASLTSINVNPNNPYDILVTLGGTGSGQGHVYRATNTFFDLTPTLPASIPALFTNQSGFPGFTALPDVTVNDITRDPADPENTWYAATDIGVFMTKTSGTKWLDATTPLGLPNVQVNAIKAVPGTGFLNVATFGRGVWRIKLADSTVADPGAPVITVKPAYARLNGNIVVSLNITNSGGPATNLAVGPVTLTVAGTAYNATSTVPANIARLAGGATQVVEVTFPGTVGRTGALAVLNVSGTYDGGTFQLTGTRTRLP